MSYPFMLDEALDLTLFAECIVEETQWVSLLFYESLSEEVAIWGRLI